MGDPDKLLKLNGGSPALTMTGFQKVASKAGPPEKPQQSPDKLPAFPKSVSAGNFKVFDTIPSLADFEEYGYDVAQRTATFAAGERQAMKRVFLQAVVQLLLPLCLFICHL